MPCSPRPDYDDVPNVEPSNATEQLNSPPTTPMPATCPIPLYLIPATLFVTLHPAITVTQVLIDGTVTVPHCHDIYTVVTVDSHSQRNATPVTTPNSALPNLIYRY